MAGAVLEVEIAGLDRVQRLIREMPQTVDAAARRGIDKAARAVLRRVRERVNYRGGYSAEYLHHISGKLDQSANASDPERGPYGWQARVGFREGPAGKYSRIHEYGGVIRAKGGGYLTFKYIDRGQAPPPKVAATLERRRRQYGRAQDYSGRGAERWARVKQVTIPERAPLRTALSERRQLIHELLQAEMNVAAREAERG